MKSKRNKLQHGAAPLAFKLASSVYETPDEKEKEILPETELLESASVSSHNVVLLAM
jgi:hypothetical protein